MPAKLTKPNFNHYFDYEEVKACLGGFAAAAPSLCRLSSIGETHRGRDILMLEVTDFSSGPSCEKNGLYVDACTHSEEICGTNAALYLAWHLLSSFDSDESIRGLLRRAVFYIIPRLNPDGVEYILKLSFPGNGNGRYLPEEFQTGNGLHFCDIDGDGHIAQMRIQDPDGEWKISDKDPRLMSLRQPWDKQGPFYRLYPEGYVQGDTVGFEIPPSRSGNLNRNYPGKWKPEGLQYGGGELPLFEPETGSVARFIVAHPNIAGVMSLHTNAAAVMRPFFSLSDENYLGQDLSFFNTIGKMGTEELGYPVLSFYEHLTPDKSKTRTGALCDWTFDFLGIPSYLVEFWSVYDAAGTSRPENFHFGAPSEQTEYDVMRWTDKEIGPEGYLPWKPFRHPQLGDVEIGGRNRIWVERNPPVSYLEDLSEKGSNFILKFAKTLPYFTFLQPTAKKLADSIYKVSIITRNSGFMPTNLTAQAEAVHAAPLPYISLSSEGSEILCASHPNSIPHLAGRFGRIKEWTHDLPNWAPNECRSTWIVRTSAERPLFDVTVSCDRVGTSRCSIDAE